MVILTDSSQIIQDRANELPKSLVSVVTDDLRRFVDIIQKDFDLTPQDTASLENEILLTLLAFEPLEELALNIKTHTTVSNKTADHISEKVNSELLRENFGILLELNNQQHNTDTSAKATSVSVNEPTSSAGATVSEVTPPVPEHIKVQASPKSEQTQPVVPVSNSEPEPIVQPLRTMEGDMERIHGYGAYRKMYPLAEDGQVVASEPEHTQPTVEPIHTSTQDAVLEEKPALAEMPSYTDAYSKADKNQSKQKEPAIKKTVQTPSPPTNLPTE